MNNITERELIYKMCNALNMIKGFTGGHSTGIGNKCIIEYGNEVFFIKVEKRPDETLEPTKIFETFDRLNNWE